MSMDLATSEFYRQYVDSGAVQAEAPVSAISHYFDRAFGPGGKVLDVGAGSGRDMALLQQRGFDVYGVEPNDAMRLFALKNHPGLTGRLQAAASLPAIGRPYGGEFDGIVCSAMLMHIPARDLPAAALSLHGLLKPHGRVLISVPSMDPDALDGERDRDGRFFQNHAPDTIRGIFEALGLSEVARWDSALIPLPVRTQWFVLLFELSA